MLSEFTQYVDIYGLIGFVPLKSVVYFQGQTATLDNRIFKNAPILVISLLYWNGFYIRIVCVISCETIDSKKNFVRIQKVYIFAPSLGKMAERSNAAVLKTVDLHGSGGSNPSLSAK